MLTGLYPCPGVESGCEAGARRWYAGQRIELPGITLIIERGRKAVCDLVVSTESRLHLVTFEEIAAQVDFLVENERHLKQWRPHWRETARDHYLGFLGVAIDIGYEAAYERMVRRPRERSA